MTAYISGESRYSKSQKDAVRQLVTFIEYGDLKVYDSFLKSLSTPIMVGDAFRDLLNSSAHGDAQAKFVLAGVPTSDAQNLVWLYAKFNQFEFMNRAIRIWGRTDMLIHSLLEIGLEIKNGELLTGMELDRESRADFIKRVTIISDKLTEEEILFSQIMNDMTRKTTISLFWVNTLVITFMLTLVALISTILIRKLSRSKSDLELKNAGLVATNDKLDNFIYVASHNLKSPINNMKGLINIWGMMAISDPERSLHDKMDESVNDLSITINRLEDLMVIDSQSDTDGEWVSFSDLFFQITEEFGGHLAFNKVNIITDFKVDTVFYSEMSLRLIILNLLSNSIKYRSLDRTASIEVSSYLEDGFTVLRIKDNGLGMNLELHGNDIYGMFRRYNENVSGIGVGLYLVKQVVDRNNGKIEVQSDLGKGTDFRIFLKNE